MSEPSKPQSFWDQILALPPDGVLIAIPIEDRAGNKGYMQLPLDRGAFVGMPAQKILDLLDAFTERELKLRDE